jgi:tetratricopeptide (TPR) repeat protein
MPKIHPKPCILRDLALYPPEHSRRLLRHLADCPSCHAVMAGLAPDGAIPPEAPEVPQGKDEAGPQKPLGRVIPLRSPEDDYGQAVDNVLARLRPRIVMADREQAEAPALFAELERNPPQRRELLVRNSERFRSFGLCRLMVRAGMENGVRDRQAAEGWAKLTLQVLNRLDSGLTGARVIEDLRARTWAVLGNSRRTGSDLRGAETAFQTAEIHLRRGTGDRLEREHVLARKASLRRAQRRFEEAINLARRATSICLASGEPVRAARSVVVWALTYREAGEPENALHLLTAAERLASSDSDPYLALAVRHNRIICLTDAGRALAARRLLARSQGLYELRTGPLVELRRLWL